MTTLAEKKGFIWFDGKIVNSEEANVHVLTHTLHYGLGVFEGVRAYETPEVQKYFGCTIIPKGYFHLLKQLT